MLLHNKQTDSLIKVTDIETLINPTESKISGCQQAGEDEKTPEEFAKDSLTFPSGESLPRCWVDADYKEAV